MGREIYDIINDMAEVLNASQMQKLQEVLVKRLSENNASDYLQTTNTEFLDMFLTAKHLEGCSDKTIRYYKCNIEKMLETINIPVIKITIEMLRKYLVEYQAINNCGKVTIDNIRRSLSTFFDAKTKIHLLNYIESRKDNNNALFVSLNKPYSRLTESGVELRLREKGKKLGVERCIHINLEGLWQLGQLKKGCQLNKCRKYLDMSKLIQRLDMLWLIKTM